MPTGSQPFDFNQDAYRLVGTVSWSISGSTVTWTMSYTTYEYVVKIGSYYCFQGLQNSAVRLYVGSSYVEATQQYTGYAYGTHSSRSDAGWVQAKTGTLTTTSTLTTSEVNTKPTIVVPDADVAIPFILSWNVSYNGNASTSGSTSSQTKVIDTTLTLRSNGYTKTGYTFSKWNTKADGSGTNYSAGGNYTENSSATLYAQWEINTYAVTYNGNGNTGGSTASQTKTYGTNLTLRSNGFTKTGYTFSKWNTKADGSGTNYNAGATYSTNAALTLYAIWTINTYTVSYDANGGSGAPSSQTKTYGTTLTLSSTIPTRSNSSAGSYTVTLNANGGSVNPSSQSAARTNSYTFSKWNTKADGSGTNYSAGGNYTTNAATTLYAQWTSSTATASVTLPTPTRSGYTFNKWNTKQDGSGTNYNAGASYTPSGNVTLYAQWTINTYTVSYNGNGNTGGSTASQTKTYGVTLTLRSNGFTRTGYTFLNWNTAANGSGTTYNAGASYTANSSVTLYAQWKKNNIPVYVNVGGNVYQVEKAYVNVGGTIKECTVYANVGGTIKTLT